MDVIAIIEVCREMVRRLLLVRKSLESTESRPAINSRMVTPLFVLIKFRACWE